MISNSVKTLNYRFQLGSAKEAIRTTLDNCERPIVTTKFNEDSAVILHLVSQIQPGISVVWVDTGYNSNETLSFAEELTAKLRLSLHTFRPLTARVDSPPDLYTDEHTQFTNDVKIEPFNRALKELRADVWISSIRRYQTSFRNNLQIYDQQSSGLLKLSPLLDWSAADIERYLEEHKLAVGPECFDPTKGNQTYRECGLHYNRA